MAFRPFGDLSAQKSRRFFPTDFSNTAIAIPYRVLKPTRCEVYLHTCFRGLFIGVRPTWDNRAEGICGAQTPAHKNTLVTFLEMLDTECFVHIIYKFMMRSRHDIDLQVVL